MRSIFLRSALSIVFATLALHAQTWTQAFPQNAPSARYGIRMAWDAARGQAVLFGGHLADGSFSNATFLWNGTNWSAAQPSTSPSARSDYAVAYDEDRQEVVLFGGWTGSVSLNDTWVWNGTVWTQRTTANSPTAAFNPTMVYDPVRRQVVLFGGADSNGARSDTWVWNGTVWTRLTPANAPPPGSNSEMVWDASTQTILFYRTSNSLTDEVWSWNGSNWTKITPGGTTTPGDSRSGAGKFVNHNGKVLFVKGPTFLWSSGQWSRIMSGGSVPTTRSWAAAVYDPVRARTILFGGTDALQQSFFGDTWSLDLGNSCVFTAELPASVNIAPDGSGTVITVPAQANCAWAATTSSDLVTATPASGTGPGSVTVSAAPNPLGDSRWFKLRLGGQDIDLRQNQQLCSAFSSVTPLPPSPVLMPFGCGARSYTYTAAAGSQISLRTGARKSGLTGDAYMDTTISGPAPSSTVLTTIPGVVRPSMGNLTFPAAGTYTITFTPAGFASGSYAIADWMKTGDACTPKFSPLDLTTSISLSPYSADALSFSPFDLNDNNSNANGLIAGLAPGCASLPVSTGAAWLTAAPASIDPGYNSIKFTPAINYGAARTTSLTVGPASISVRQLSTGCTASLAPATASVDSGRTVATVQLTTNCTAWDASSDQSWVQVYPLNGTANSIGPVNVSVQYTVFPNFTSSSRTAALAIAGQTFTITQAAGTGTANERFVRLLYFNFFGRIPTAAEIAFQVNSGLSREQLATNFFNSQELSIGGRFVAGLYIGLLNRNAEYGGWLWQRDNLARGLIDHTSATWNFLFSQEFRLQHPSLSSAGFVTLLYNQVLFRQPTTAELDYQTGVLIRGTKSYDVLISDMALSFLLSQEFALGANKRITAFVAYSCLLQREPTPAELTAGMAVSQAQLISQLLTSPEFTTVLQ